MISGAHVMIYTKDDAADRAFLRDMLEVPNIDSGGGWLIFKLPPTELGIHEAERNSHEVYFIVDDIDAFAAKMADKGVATDPITEQSWGRSTGIDMPGGWKLGLYQPMHARP
jgi:hypothetical protein